VSGANKAVSDPAGTALASAATILPQGSGGAEFSDDRDGQALPPDAAKQQIQANYADPAFVAAYTDERAPGHAAAVAAMAHLHLQAYPPDDGPWPSLAWCVRHVARTLGLGIGPAGAAICQACAAGLIRWQGFTVERPTPQDWRDGRIDASGRYLIGRGHCHDLLWLSGDDLADWLQRRQSEAVTPGLDGTAAASGEPTERRPAGRPSAMHIIEVEMRRRASADPCELLDTLSGECEVLAKWVRLVCAAMKPPIQAPGEKTIANKLRNVYRELRAQPKPSNQAPN